MAKDQVEKVEKMEEVKESISVSPQAPVDVASLKLQSLAVHSQRDKHDAAMAVHETVLFDAPLKLAAHSGLVGELETALISAEHDYRFEDVAILNGVLARLGEVSMQIKDLTKNVNPELKSLLDKVMQLFKV